MGSGSSSLDDSATAGAEAARAALAGLAGSLAAVRGVTGDAPLVGASASGQFADGEFLPAGTSVSVMILGAGVYRFGTAAITGIGADTVAAGHGHRRCLRPSYDGCGLVLRRPTSTRRHSPWLDQPPCAHGQRQKSARDLGPGESFRVIFHADQAGEYTGGLFRAACARAQVRQSLGRAGSGLDNAIVGSFNSTFEFELFAGASRFATRAQARTAVPSGRHPVAGQHWLHRA